MLIRTEKPQDRDFVRDVNVSAFDTPAEADLVDALREHAQSCVSFVAEQDGKIVGHILFSPVSLSGHPGFPILGLGPMAVAPEHQRKGIGTALVKAGLDRCKQLGFEAAVVLGHPGYYPRFGFSPSSRFGIDSVYEVPEDVFMAIELVPGSLEGRSGTVHYHAEFGNV